ncbi:MAG: type III-A CRISPR-associated protein Csm2 [Saprospirales bacterium]|nr:type III-A CRISPR-associated protein Csm2 [Saprospirales bacterium]
MKIKKFNDQFEPVLNASKQQEEIELQPDWIAQENLPMEAILFAEYFGRHLVGPKRVEDKKNPGKQMTVFSGGLSTSQIRNFFGEVRTIQMKGFEESGSDFVMLKPRLAFESSSDERQCPFGPPDQGI